MEDKETQQKLPLDARLLSDAVIELNISRRSVGLYPPDHPITRQSLEKAYSFLKKLFELRSSITLGIAKDVLTVDEYKLDRRNPVFKEFALALHAKGVAAVTFYSGLEEKELLAKHMLLTDKDSPAGTAFVELAKTNGITHIQFVPLDVTKLKFVEDVLKDTKGSVHTVWEDYVHGLMEGTLADDESDNVVLNIPPEQIAAILGNYTSEKKEESYDRIITAYLRKKNSKELNSESLNRFMTLVESLSPQIKGQLLSKAFAYSSLEHDETAEMLSDLTPEEVERMFNIMKNQESLPENLRNLLKKLSDGNLSEDIRETISVESGRVDDIEVNEEIVKLFEDDQYGDFVDTQYQGILEKMLKTQNGKPHLLTKELDRDMSPDIIDSAFSDVILNLVDSEHLKRENHLQLLTRLSELIDVYMETGRFEEILKIHNTIYSDMLTGRFSTDSLSMIEYFFHSEYFISRFLDALKIWGKHQRDATIKLARAFRVYLINPVLNALTEEQSTSQRKFYIAILSYMGKDILPEVVKRLDDKRWYVVRNMIFLIKNCRGTEYIAKIRPLIKHKNKKISIEALKTLLHFNTSDAFDHLQHFLTGKDPVLKEEAIRLSGAYRIKKTVPYLLEILQKRDVLSLRTNYKLLAISALGKIGDPCVLDTFKMLHNSSGSLPYKLSLDSLKIEIIKSLESFPPDKRIRDILELASVSKNKEIRSLAQKLLLKE